MPALRLHWCLSSINELFKDYAKIKLHSPPLLPPSAHPNPSFSYSQIGHIYPWTIDNETPVIPGPIVTLEGFWHSSTHQVLLLPLYLEPNPKVFQTAFRFFISFPFKVAPSWVKHCFVPQVNTAFFSDSVHWMQWSWPTLVGLCSPAVFQPPRGHFCFSCRLCLVLLWINEDAPPAPSVLPAWRSPWGKGTAQGQTVQKAFYSGCIDLSLVLWCWTSESVRKLFKTCVGFGVSNCLPENIHWEANASKIADAGCIHMCGRRNATSVSLEYHCFCNFVCLCHLVVLWVWDFFTLSMFYCLLIWFFWSL